jgi:hypothetical protein
VTGRRPVCRRISTECHRPVRTECATTCASLLWVVYCPVARDEGASPTGDSSAPVGPVGHGRPACEASQPVTESKVKRSATVPRSDCQEPMREHVRRTQWHSAAMSTAPLYGWLLSFSNQTGVPADSYFAIIVPTNSSSITIELVEKGTLFSFFVCVGVVVYIYS